MKSSIVVFAFLMTRTMWSAQKLEISVKHFKYENSRTKIEDFIIHNVSERLAENIYNTYCFDEKVLPSTSIPVLIKKKIAEIIGANIDSFILCNRPYRAYDKIYGIEQDKQAYEKTFDKPDKCLYIYEKLFQ